MSDICDECGLLKLDELLDHVEHECDPRDVPTVNNDSQVEN